MLNTVNLSTNVSHRSEPRKHTAKSCCNFGNTLISKKDSNVKASNQHGDTLNVSFGNRQFQEYTPANIYPPFKVTVDQIVRNLINSADGMIPYPQNFRQSWQVFPQKNSYPEVPGFKQDLSLNGEHTFNKAQKDGGIDFMEKQLSANQLAQDASMYPPGTPESNAFLNARNLLCALFERPVNIYESWKLRPEFDVNVNGKFDADDAQVLAVLDGEIDSISSADLNKATTNFVMNRPYVYATMPVQLPQK